MTYLPTSSQFYDFLVTSLTCSNRHERKIQEREVSRRGFYAPWTRADINPVLGSSPKKYANRYYQLKVGHGAVGTCLARIVVIETPECWWYKEVVQSVEHL